MCVVVIGGGFMGLSVALALAGKGIDVALVEAAQVGWGASGRNNSLVAPGLKRDPWEVRKILGSESGERLLRFSGSAPDVVYNLIDTHSIDCDLNRGGWIQAAHSRRALPVIERRVSEWQALGADVALIPPAEVPGRLGTDHYAGAWFDRRGGSINPLAFVLGLAKAADDAGASIFEQSPATSIERTSTGWRVATPKGTLHCEQLVCCTNAYNDDIEKLRGTVMPLPKDMTASLLPGGESASDTQRLLTSFRLTADNRLIMGGASATAGDEHSGLMHYLHKGAAVRFPAFGKIPWEFGWSGYLALTPDHLPQILRVDDGYFAGVGCNGRGIAMATVTGRSIANLVCGQDEKECSVPVRRPRRVFGYGMRHAGVAIGVRINRFLDIVKQA